MKTIELFGIPATGKSYLLNKLQKRFRFNNKIILSYFNSYSPFNLIRKCITIIIASLFFLNIKAIFKFILFFINFYKPIKSNLISLRTIRIFFNAIYLISLIKLSHFLRRKILIIDQGLYQLLWSILYEMDYLNKANSHFIITEWISIVNSLNIKLDLFHCKARKKTILNRLALRKGNSIIEKIVNEENYSYYFLSFAYIISEIKLNNINKNTTNIYSINCEKISLERVLSFIKINI
tara:strand:- start:43 stop:753 length:711 start_codon:yes stop_codon:yes gene_type:complete